jgi:hypothetical protein
MKINFNLIIGVILLVLGIVLAKMSFAHYYTFFSVGLLLILLEIYKKISGESVFRNWKVKDHFIFWISIIVIAAFFDRFGMGAGYWIYPSYSGMFDEIIKLIFEWAVPLVYLMVGMMVGIKIFKGAGKFGSFVLSLIVFVFALGLFTEYVNMFVYSWKILKMPFSSYNIKGYFIMFQTFGYWAMTIIPYAVYSIVRRVRR